MNTLLIVSNPNIMMGKPVIAGTRITVESILERLGGCETPEQIVAANPRLTPQILAQIKGMYSQDKPGENPVLSK